MDEKNLNCLIVSNGLISNANLLVQILKNNYNFYDFYNEKNTGNCALKRSNNNYLIISTDGAVRNCLKLKLLPDIVIGDMDSIKLKDKNNLKELNKINKKINYISFSCDKNESDTQLAIEYAAKNNIKDIILIGALGKRIDHSLANIFNISCDKFKDLNIKIIDENFEISVLRKSEKIIGNKGNLISIFSLTPFTYFISTKGLKYELKEEKLYFSPIRGISNIFTEDIAEINISEGILLIIKQIIKR